MPLRIVPIKVRGSILSTAAVLTAATKAIRDTQAEGVRLMATYPPARPESRYRRTGTLKRSWSMPPVVMQGNALVGEIFSNGGIAPYNEKVEGEGQDPFFAGRGWPSVKALVALVNKQLGPRVQAAIDRAAQAGKGGT